MTGHASTERQSLPVELLRQIDGICDEFQSALKQGRAPEIADHLHRVDPCGRETLLSELCFLACNHLRAKGSKDPKADLLSANRDIQDEILVSLAKSPEATTRDLSPRATHGRETGLRFRCPHCHNAIDVVFDVPLLEVVCPTCGGGFSLVDNEGKSSRAEALGSVAHFDLIQRLGMGAFGAVWKARDTLLDRIVAVKIPRHACLSSEEAEKFMREARAAAQLRHRNIVSIHEVGRDGDTLFIVNDYVRGVPLSEVLLDDRLGFRQSAELALKVADALQHAHDAGVVHRDLKPSNILIDEEGDPNLLDFGLAKRQDRELTITTDGAILGTPAYMSPEQARGEGHGVDGRSDVYSLGVILFQMLTGDMPFRGTTQMLLHKVINDPAPSPRWLDGTVPKDLDTICCKCLEKEPSRRYDSARDLAADLRRYLSGRPIHARRVGQAGKAIRWSMRNKAMSAVIATSVLILVAASAISSYFAWMAERERLEVTNALYESVDQEIRLTRQVRKQGYRDVVVRLVRKARDLKAPQFNSDELRHEVAYMLGDFVGFPPTEVSDFAADITAIRLGDISEQRSEVFVGLKDGSLLAVDSKSGRRKPIGLLSASVQTIGVSDDKNRLVAADLAGVAQIWQREGDAWRPGATMALGEKPFTVIGSPDGKYVAYLKNSRLDIWDVDRKQKTTLGQTEPSWEMRNIAFDLRHGKVVAAYMDRENDTVGWGLWDLETGEQIDHYERQSLGQTYSNAIAFGFGGRYLAIGFDEALLIFDMARESGFTNPNTLRFDSTKAVAFSPVQYRFAAVNLRGQAALWNLVGTEQIASLDAPASPGVNRENAAFSDDGSLLAASNSKAIRIWDLSRADERIVLAGHLGGVPCVAFHSDRELLVSGGKDNAIRFWNPSTGREIDSVDINEAVQALAFSPNGQYLAIGCLGRTDAAHLRIMDVESRQLLNAEPPIIQAESPPIGHVNSLAWVGRPGNSSLAASGRHGVAFWRMTTDGTPILKQEFGLGREWCFSVAVDSNAEHLVWTEEENHLRALHVDRQIETVLPPMLGGWHGIEFLPVHSPELSANTIIFVAENGVAEVWDVEKNQKVKQIGQPNSFRSSHLAVSPNGKWLAALTEPDVVSIWEMSTNRHLYSLRSEKSTIWSLAWSRDSNQLAIGRSNGGLAVWRMERIREELQALDLDW